MQVLALTCVKLSYLFFYQRVLRVGNSWIFDIAMYSMIVIALAWAVAFFFGFVFVCAPHFDYLWTSLATEAKCAHTTDLHNAYAISDVIQDTLILIFPLPRVGGRFLQKRKS